MRNWFGSLFSKDLTDALNQTKKVYIQGIRFEIKRISPMDYFTGIDPFVRFFATYEDKKAIEKALGHSKDLPVKKIQDHYRSVFLAGVVRPKLSAKDDGVEIFVDDLFEDWELCNQLYAAIHNYTYGVKKKTLPTFLRAA